MWPWQRRSDVTTELSGGEEEEEGLREQLDMHSIIVPFLNQEPLFTAEQVSISSSPPLVLSDHLSIHIDHPEAEVGPQDFKIIFTCRLILRTIFCLSWVCDCLICFVHV